MSNAGDSETSQRGDGVLSFTHHILSQAHWLCKEGIASALLLSPETAIEPDANVENDLVES